MDTLDAQALELDPLRMRTALREAFIARQNIGLAVLGGLIGAAMGAALWAVVTVLTKFQIGFMALGVGWLVGNLAWSFGRGLSPAYGVVGAILALLGCAAGNLLSSCYFLSQAPGIEASFWGIVKTLNFDVIAGLMELTFHPIDVVFYFIAVYEGFRFSFRRLAI